MRLFVSFSARKDGNSDEIARYLAKEDDQIIYFRDLNVHNCSNCDYECFETSCKYCNDDIYNLLEEMCKFQNPTKAKIELSAMAVVMCNGKILSTNEMIYGKETLSLPKGHKEENETIIETAIRECYEETNIIVIKDDLVKELTSFSYEFLTPSNKLIRKTIVPFLFEIKEEGNPIPKEERMISVQWMDINEFLEKCTHENVKEIVKEI